MSEIRLTGCHPEPLMSYLKALGILRLVAEQADPNAVARWHEDDFILQSNLNKEDIIHFFLYEYKPTPIVGPWAGGSGFFKGDNTKSIQKISISKTERSADYQNIIKTVKSILQTSGIKVKPTEAVKEALLKRFKCEMPDIFIQWMDAVMVIQSEGQSFAPLLGTGGNDGRLDFTQNFMSRLVDLGIFSDTTPSSSKELLEQSFFGVAIKGLGKASVGQFSPSRSGGANSSQGMEGSATDNPWDFVLMIEGTLVLAGSVVRYLGISSTDKAAFPFTVRSRPIGEASPSEEETGSSRGEIWLPVWSQYISFGELKATFAEGRAELSGKPVRDSIDFARAIAELGVDRGIQYFSRYGFFKRSGKAYLATAMDRFQVPEHPRDASKLIQQITPWLDKYRRTCSAKEIPNRFKSVLRRIDTGIFDYCRYGRREDLEAILIALGKAEKELAVIGGKRGDKEISPPLAQYKPLSHMWREHTYDDSKEYDIALALATIYDPKIGSIRSNIEPVSRTNGKWEWQPSGPQVVWKNIDLSSNMSAVLERRIMDAARHGCKTLPIDHKRSLTSTHIAYFLAKEVDDQRIEELLWGLLLIDQKEKIFIRNNVSFLFPLPREYALLKLLYLPRSLVSEEDNQGKIVWRMAKIIEKDNQQKLEAGRTIRPEPRILPLLRAGRMEEACRIASQRLHVSGFTPLTTSHSFRIWQESDFQHPAFNDDSLRNNYSQRLAAALLLPIQDQVINEIVRLVTRQENIQEDEETQEENEAFKLI